MFLLSFVIVFFSLLLPLVAFRMPISPSFNPRSSLQMTSEWASKIKQHTTPGSIVVIKYGGHAMENEELKDMFFDDIAELYTEAGIIPVIVHGGGPQIAKMLKTLNVESKFINGLRVTDPATMEVAQMVLCGLINKDLVRRVCLKPGVKGALGLSGLDSKLIQATQKDPSLGLVGEPSAVNAEVIVNILQTGLIPIIAPVGSNVDGSGSLNINADTSAGFIAQALKADKFLLLTDIAGVLDKNKQLIEKLPISSFESLVSDGTLSGGMIPKVENAVLAVRAGVKSVAIMDGRVKHSVLRALAGEKVGTIVSN